MHRFEDRHIAAEVGRRREPEATHQRRSEVADDVAVHVGGDDHIELFGLLHQLVRAVVDDDVPRLDLGILGGDALERALHFALGEFHDVRLGGAGHRRAALGAGELEGQTDDLLGTLGADELQALRHIGGLHVLDTGVQVFHVLAHHHQVDATARVRGVYPRQLAHRTDIGVGLEQLAQRDVGRLLAIAHRGTERSLQHQAGVVDGIDGVGPNARGDAFCEHTLAGVPFDPLDLDAGGIDDVDGRVDAFGADAVAGDEGDAVLAHGVLLQGWVGDSWVEASEVGYRGLRRPGARQRRRRARCRTHRRGGSASRRRCGSPPRGRGA